MSDACARLTKAPLVGLPTSCATSSVQKPMAVADMAAATAKPMPPKTISPLRLPVSPASPISGSSALPTKAGTASSSPISV